MVLLCQRLEGQFCRPSREFMATMTIHSSKYYLNVCQVLFPLRPLHLRSHASPLSHLALHSVPILHGARRTQANRSIYYVMFDDFVRVRGADSSDGRGRGRLCSKCHRNRSSRIPGPANMRRHHSLAQSHCNPFLDIIFI